MIRLPKRAAAAGAAWALLVALAWLTAGGTGCFFDPREPEASVPIDTSGTRWRPASTPMILVNNIVVTFVDQQIDFYRRSFRDDFAFIADPLDATDLAQQGRFPYLNYGREAEEQVAQILFSDHDEIRLKFTDLSPPYFVSSEDTAEVRKNYVLTLVDIDSLDGGGVTADSAVYEGVLSLFMRDEANEWALYRWEDRRGGNPQIDSWGLLRGLTRP